jgi:hypothetical protein
MRNPGIQEEKKTGVLDTKKGTWSPGFLIVKKLLQSK